MHDDFKLNPSELGAQGGKARARALSPDHRTEIAKRAAASRWTRDLPKALRSAPLTIAGIELECAVLDNKEHTRVISETRFMAALGMYRSGALSSRRKKGGGAREPLFLAYKNLKPFVEKHLTPEHFEPVQYVTPEGSVATTGIRASVLPKICEVWIDADRAGVLGPRQRQIAAKADILFRGFAQVGLIALIDEATGWQADRAKDDLVKILEAFVTEQLQPWVSTFTTEYYQHLFRLRGWTFPKLPKDQVKRPILVGKLTNDIVYARLAPGVRRELHRLTPRDSKGRLKQKLFQRLTKNLGHPKLKEHNAAVVALMKVSDDWDTFMKVLDKALPRHKDLPLFDVAENEVTPVL